MPEQQGAIMALYKFPLVATWRLISRKQGYKASVQHYGMVITLCSSGVWEFSAACTQAMED